MKCNLCGGSKFKSLSSRGRFFMPVKNVVCKKCGLVFQNPMQKKNG